MEFGVELKRPVARRIPSHDEEEDDYEYFTNDAHLQAQNYRTKMLSIGFCIIFLLVTLCLTLVAIFTSVGTSHENISDPTTLLSLFVNISSISGNETQMGIAVESWLKSRGWILQRQGVTQTTFNLFAHKGNPNPKLIICSHLDTVPPFIPVTEDTENIYGRGSADAKGSIVAQLFAVEQLLGSQELDPNDIGLLYVVEEETTSRGMIKANDLGLTPKYLIVGEPTERKLATGHKGSVSFKIESFGKESHSGYPELGVSAILPLLNVITELEKQEWPADDFFGPSTLNTGFIEGGHASNVVPGYASASIFIRNTKTIEEIKSIVESVVTRNFTLTYLTTSNPFRCDIVEGFETELMNFGTDLPHFIGNQKSYLFGPGSILVSHTKDEFLSKFNLAYGISDYKVLIKNVLAQEKNIKNN